ncbi:hypothetical protein Asera_06090 [Actinocatenispora sera]|uniref:Uncharacterized protein n=1 Tax=Actinocatenispora sera TaxID=390989 RepID=A0A810KW41_9ACTN|nr:hypothetical protein Asera_06090 [Actinocatenispora sera]
MAANSRLGAITPDRRGEASDHMPVKRKAGLTRIVRRSGGPADLHPLWACSERLVRTAALSAKTPFRRRYG